MKKICEKCGYKRTNSDNIIPDYECPKCSKVYGKKRIEDKTKNCHFCNEKINIKAIKCKHCNSMLNKETLNKWFSFKPYMKVFILLIVFSFIYNFTTIYSKYKKKYTDLKASTMLETIEDKVALDAEEQYYIAHEQGDYMSICVQAGFVAAAYLQVKDKTNYNKWKENEEVVCSLAGINN